MFLIFLNNKNVFKTSRLSCIYALISLTQIPNIFPISEYENRITALRRYMSQNDIAASILTSYSNILYYSGYFYYSWGRNFALVVTRERTCVISHPVNGGNQWRRCYGDCLVYTDWKKGNFFKALKQAVGDTKHGKIGI